MIKVMVSGCNGKMGKELINSIDNFEGFVLVSGFDFKDIGINTFPVYNNISQISQTPDVIIDFSFPVCTLEILKYATKSKVPIVIATTGFLPEQMSRIKQASKFIPIFQSYNMSYTINLIKKVVAQIATAMPDSDIEIVETHHKNKIDAPSGTAISLADAISSALPYDTSYVFNRHVSNKKRCKGEIGFSSIRGGNIVGEHSVKFFGEHETLEITHSTYSRSVFVEGALKAAKFLVSQVPGIYNMDHLINLKNIN